MKYISDVVLILNKEGQEKLQQKLNDQPIYRQKFFSDNCIKTDPKTGIRLFYWEQLKWYCDDNENVDFLKASIKRLSNRLFLFIRTCETTMDIETLGRLRDDPFDIKVTIQISWR